MYFTVDGEDDGLGVGRPVGEGGRYALWPLRAGEAASTEVEFPQGGLRRDGLDAENEWLDADAVVARVSEGRAGSFCERRGGHVSVPQWPESESEAVRSCG